MEVSDPPGEPRNRNRRVGEHIPVQTYPLLPPVVGKTKARTLTIDARMSAYGPAYPGITPRRRSPVLDPAPRGLSKIGLLILEAFGSAALPDFMRSDCWKYEVYSVVNTYAIRDTASRWWRRHEHSETPMISH